MNESPGTSHGTEASPDPADETSSTFMAEAVTAPSSSEQPRRILFLDDDHRRADVFLKRCPEAVWVLTAGDCIVRLVETWDEVHLDHDLGGEKFVDVNRDDCGMAVVRWLCAEDRRNLRNARFFIHSYNFGAASLMVECLLQNGYTAEFRPFGFDLVDFLSFEPPPRPNYRRIAWRRLVEFWRRLSGRRHKPRGRVTANPATRYSSGGGRSDAGAAVDHGQGSARSAENQL